MAQKTSINIKPCNIGSSEPHNRRTAEYLTRINKEKFYIRTDLMAGNETWVSPDFGDTTLTDRYNQIAQMVKEKTGRAMQTKDRERVNKKTGKVTIVRGSTPLKEGVVVIKEDTTMEQLRKFCEVCRERWGVTALQVFIHRDEGHYGTPGDNATWKPNLHAHIVWDWMNHDTGKSHKLQDTDMSEMQSVLAECLKMQRGISKAETGKEHLDRTDFILAKQKERLAAQQSKLDELTLKVSDMETLLENVSAAAYDKAVEVVTDVVRTETRKEDMRMIEDTKKWVLSPERKAPQATREYVAHRLDGVLDKFLKTMQTTAARLQEKLLKPEVRQKGKEQVKEKARDSVLQLLNRLQAEQAQRNPSALSTAEKSENRFQ